MKLSPDKCKFLLKEVIYLRYMISKEGVKSNIDKINANKEFNIPKNQNDIVFRCHCLLSKTYLKFC